jgi:hypothetical protein
MCPDADRYPFLISFMIATYGGSKAKLTSFLWLGRKEMGTILIVLLVVFLLSGGGWGYSRWRRN